MVASQRVSAGITLVSQCGVKGHQTAVARLPLCTEPASIRCQQGPPNPLSGSAWMMFERFVLPHCTGGHVRLCGHLTNRTTLLQQCFDRLKARLPA